VTQVALSAPYSRLEHFAKTGSTNDVVRGWLAAGTAEVCVAVADEQEAGRGRLGRTWSAPAGAALLLSLGFRPNWLAADRVWRLGATVALAMADAGEEVAGLPTGTVRLKWPNDLVVETSGPRANLAGIEDAEVAAALLRGPVTLRKLAGVLGESDGLGTDDPRVVVGIGINADWAAADFPADLAASMTSLREASAGRPIDRDALIDAFLGHFEMRFGALKTGYFDIATWAWRQATTGRLVQLEGYGAAADRAEFHASGVDGATGALLVVEPGSAADPTPVHAGEVRHVRLAAAATGEV
jgi:BirA family biotin operon repressor/biotin-[acetyl-CoA-carboxylase] ligase